MEAIAGIPDSAAVSASCQLVPHLAFRHKIYQFPIVDDVSYVALLDGENTYPISRDYLKTKIQEYLVSPEWSTKYSSGSIYVFQKTDNKHIVTTDTIVPNIFYSSVIKGSGSDRSGITGYNMQGREFSPTIEYDCRKLKANPRLLIVANVLFRVPVSYQLLENTACLVFSIEENGVSYFYKCVDLTKNKIMPEGYMAIETSYCLPKLKPNSTLKVYIWNVQNIPITLFDLNLKERIKN